MLKNASTADTIVITTQDSGYVSIGAQAHIFAVHRQTVTAVLARHASHILTSVDEVNDVVSSEGLPLQYRVRKDEKGQYKYDDFLAQVPEFIRQLACLNVELDEEQQVADPASQNKEDGNGQKAHDDDEEIIKKIRLAARVQSRSRNPRPSEQDAMSSLVHNQDAHVADYDSQIHDRPHSPSPEDADLFNDMHED